MNIEEIRKFINQEEYSKIKNYKNLIELVNKKLEEKDKFCKELTKFLLESNKEIQIIFPTMIEKIKKKVQYDSIIISYEVRKVN